MTMVTSFQPASSKWCWSGAIRNTRLPVSLKKPTWMITESVMMTNSPPRITTRNSVRVVILGGLFVIITLSVIIQVGFFKLTGRRVFRMAPLQHHFELAGWNEVTIVIRFWIVAGLFAALGIGVFYAEWVVGAA